MLRIRYMVSGNKFNKQLHYFVKFYENEFLLSNGCRHCLSLLLNLREPRPCSY